MFTITPPSLSLLHLRRSAAWRVQRGRRVQHDDLLVMTRRGRRRVRRFRVVHERVRLPAALVRSRWFCSDRRSQNAVGQHACLHCHPLPGS